MCYSTIAVKSLCSNHSRALSACLWREANQLSAVGLMSLQWQSGGDLYLASTLSLLSADNIGPILPSVAHLSPLKFTLRPLWWAYWSICTTGPNMRLRKRERKRVASRGWRQQASDSHSSAASHLGYPVTMELRAPSVRFPAKAVTANEAWQTKRWRLAALVVTCQGGKSIAITVCSAPAGIDPRMSPLSGCQAKMPELLTWNVLPWSETSSEMNPHLGMKLAKETNQNAAFEVSLFPFNSGQTQITDQYFHDQTGHLKNTHISEKMDRYKS